MTAMDIMVVLLDTGQIEPGDPDADRDGGSA